MLPADLASQKKDGMKMPSVPNTNNMSYRLLSRILM